MKAKSRLLWMKLHAYFACFFLPITLLYITTGMLYFFDVKGEVTETFEYSVTLENGWPSQESDAYPIVMDAMKANQQKELPADYYLYEGNHDWYGHERAVIFKPTDDPKIAKLIIEEHDLLKQLLIVHKGYAGIFFKLFSIMFGFSLAFSVISGVVITLQLPQLKNASLFAIMAGSLLLLIGFI